MPTCLRACAEARIGLGLRPLGSLHVPCSISHIPPLPNYTTSLPITPPQNSSLSPLPTIPVPVPVPVPVHVPVPSPFPIPVICACGMASGWGTNHGHAYDPLAGVWGVGEGGVKRSDRSRLIKVQGSDFKAQVQPAKLLEPPEPSLSLSLKSICLLYS